MVAVFEVSSITGQVNANPWVGQLRADFENILFRMPTNPNGAALDAVGALCVGDVINCGFDTGGTYQGQQNIPLPTYNSIALRMPGDNNFGNGDQTITGISIAGGFRNGLIFSDNFTAGSICVEECYNAICPYQSDQGVINFLSVEGCVNAICTTNFGATSRSHLTINSGHWENNIGGGAWFYAGNCLLYDPSNLLRGSYTCDALGSTVNVGGTYMHTRRFCQGNPTATVTTAPELTIFPLSNSLAMVFGPASVSNSSFSTPVTLVVSNIITGKLVVIPGMSQ
jgi:hypothetical protein